ncbi:MAG: glycosyltransferase family 2 protein, partial [Pseudomonadota bacterium]
MGSLIRRKMRGAEANKIVLIDAVAEPGAGDTRRVHLFFRGGTVADYLTPVDGLTISEVRSIGGAPWVICEAPGKGDLTAPVAMLFAGKRVEITPAPVERDLFAGKNAFVTIRNGERGEAVIDWLAFHAETQGLSAAVILSRAEPGTNPEFAAKIEKAIRARDTSVDVLVIEADSPLGRADLPPENHPFCTPDAPGKDRMEVPPPDPRRSPLSDVLVYEALRTRFLGEARAVANLDVYDLLTGEGGNVFDSAVGSDTGVVVCAGRHVYPWRGRKKALMHHADHICVQFDNRQLKQRWCVAPAVAGDAATWRLIRIGNVNFAVGSLHPFYRCMALRHHAGSVSKLVPKSSLIEHPPLMEFMGRHFTVTPERMPQMAAPPVDGGRGRVAIVTTMKNEGPFILEWIAYHRAIG